MIKFGNIHKARKRLIFKLCQSLTSRKKRADFTPGKARRLLLLRDNNKLGDLIVSTPIFRAARAAGFEVSVIAMQGNVEAIRHNPHIHQIYLHNGSLPSMLSLALRLRRQHFDALIDLLDWQPEYKCALMSNLIGARYTIGFDNPYCDVSLDGHRGLSLHASTRNAKILASLGIEPDGNETHYDLHIDPASEHAVRAFLASLPHPRTILLNPFGRSDDRHMSDAQIKAIIDLAQAEPAGLNVVISGEASDMATIDTHSAHRSPFTDFSAALALVKHADLVCSIDTSIVHVAAAYNKPIVILYQRDRDPVFKNSMIWGPNNPHAVPVFAEDNRLFAIEPASITAALRTLLR
jgi:heptosyltransferase-4